MVYTYVYRYLLSLTNAYDTLFRFLVPSLLHLYDYFRFLWFL